jgi:hypothetical protein
MGTHISTVPSMTGPATPAFSTASTMAIPIGAKERIDKPLLLLRKALAALFAVVQVCVKIFVFAAIVLWPWESAW